MFSHAFTPRNAILFCIDVYGNFRYIHSHIVKQLSEISPETCTCQICFVALYHIQYVQLLGFISFETFVFQKLKKLLKCLLT